MDSFNSYVNLLTNADDPNNTTSAPGENTPNPHNPQLSHIPQRPPYPSYPQYPNYPPHPNFPHPNFPQFPPYSQYPNYPHNPNFPTHSNFTGFLQNQSVPAPTVPAPTNRAQGRVAEPVPDAKGRKLWTPEEDRVLAGAYLTVGNDSIVGIDQKGIDLWKRVTDYYNEHAGAGHSRSQKQCKTHHHSMMKAVAQFSGCYNRSSEKWPSGASDEQITADAREEYMRMNDNKPFRFEHIWKMVREEPKWKPQPGFSSSYGSSKKTRINEAGEYTSSGPAETPVSQAESNNEYPEFMPAASEEPPSVERRPMGQKAAKRKAKGKGKAGESSNPQPFVENLEEVQRELMGKYSNLTEVMGEYHKLQEKAKRAEWRQKLFDLEDKDTSNMTPARLARHMARIANIKETWGFE